MIYVSVTRFIILIGAGTAEMSSLGRSLVTDWYVSLIILANFL